MEEKQDGYPKYYQDEDGLVRRYGEPGGVGIYIDPTVETDEWGTTIVWESTCINWPDTLIPESSLPQWALTKLQAYLAKHPEHDVKPSVTDDSWVDEAAADIQDNIEGVPMSHQACQDIAAIIRKHMHNEWIDRAASRIAAWGVGDDPSKPLVEEIAKIIREEMGKE